MFTLGIGRTKTIYKIYIFYFIFDICILTSIEQFTKKVSNTSHMLNFDFLRKRIDFIHNRLSVKQFQRLFICSKGILENFLFEPVNTSSSNAIFINVQTSSNNRFSTPSIRRYRIPNSNTPLVIHVRPSDASKTVAAQ